MLDMQIIGILLIPIYYFVGLLQEKIGQKLCLIPQGLFHKAALLNVEASISSFSMSFIK